MKRDSENAKYVGHRCQVCNKVVPVSASNAKAVGGFWKTDPKTGEVKAWYLKAPCWPPKVAA